MYSIIRIILGVILYGGLTLIGYRFKAAYKWKIHVVNVVIAVIWTTALSLVPFENCFVNFNSPEKAFRYYSYNAEVVDVISGESSDLVIGSKDTALQYLIVPKNENGWKIGVGYNTKCIKSVLDEKNSVCLYQCRKTKDHYIVVDITLNEEDHAKVSDSLNSKFTMIDRFQLGGLKQVSYYAYLSDVSDHYTVNINGKDISVPI